LKYLHFFVAGAQYRAKTLDLLARLGAAMPLMPGGALSYNYWLTPIAFFH